MKNKSGKARWRLRRCQQEGLILLAGKMNHILKSLQCAIPRLIEEAESGDDEAAFLLGVSYHEGNGVAPQYQQSIHWFTQAAVMGHVKAQYCLAKQLRSYSIREDIDDRRDAVYWFKKAAEKGHVESQYEVAICYKNGSGVKKSASEALRWLQKATANGYRGLKREIMEEVKEELEHERDMLLVVVQISFCRNIPSLAMCGRVFAALAATHYAGLSATQELLVTCLPNILSRDDEKKRTNAADSESHTS